MLEYAEDTNANHVVTIGMQFGYLLLLKKHESSDEKMQPLGAGMDSSSPKKI
jgi:hypothetical protein